MSERGNLQQELEALLLPHGVAVRNSTGVLNELYLSYRQFSLHLNETMLGDFVSALIQISHFSVFAHAQQVSERVTSKSDAWGWVKHHANMYLDAPPEAPFDRRSVVGGMANAFDRSLIALGRVKYALHWPPHLRINFVTLWQEVSTARVDIFG